MSRKRPLASSESLAPRALSPLLIPDAVPIPWDDDAATRYGVGNAAINGGLSVLVLPYEGMALGDNVEVHWDASGSPFASVVIDAGTLNQTLVLKLPEARFVAGDFQPFYRIRRESELDVDSPVRDIRVQLSVPGGQDPDPSTPHNENLHAPQVPQAILDNGVDAAQAEQGVDVTLAAYANMAEYDLIDFSWGGQPVRHTVQPGEVGRDIVLHIGKSTILAAGDGQVMLEYRVIDAAANRSEGWSLVTEVPVLAGGAVLDAPIVEGVVNGELDLNGLAGQDVTVEVLAVGASFSVGDSVELTWAGRTAGGLSVDWSDSLPVASVPQIMQFKVPYASVAAIVQGHAVVSYVLRKADGENLVSKRTQVDVTGTERSLPAPGVREASNGSLAANVAQATVEIPAYPGMAVGDLLTLVWSGEKADGQLTDYRPSHVVSSTDVGKTVLVAVAGSQYVAPLDGGKVTLWYEVSPFDGQARLTTIASERLTLTVGSAAASLPAPRVLEASNDVLASDVLQATVELAPYSGMAAGDRIDLFWRGDVSGETTAWLPIGSATVGLAVTFSVYPEDIAPNSSAEVSYRVTRAAGGVEDSTVLHLRIGEALPLPAPSIDEAVGDQLDPSDVPNGATVRIDLAANLQIGDAVTLHWRGTPGAGTYEETHIVASNEVGKDLTRIVPLAVVQANEGESITLSYDVERLEGGSESSPVAVYDVTGEIGNGELLVMGARSGQDTQSCYSDGGRLLVALDATTREPIAAQWQYEGLSTVTTGTRFQDSDPTRLLHVRTGNDEVILNVANICGARLAMVARRDEGNVVGWGYASFGGDVPSVISTFTDIVELSATGEAVAARRANGTVVAWGSSNNGGSVPAGINDGLDILHVVGSRPTYSGGVVTEAKPRAFAALRATGQVVAWGDADVGGTVPSAITALTDIVKIIGGGHAFAALRATGHVVAWGTSGDGGTVPQLIADLDDIVAVVGNNSAFAARRANGTVVAWGRSDHGGAVPAPISGYTDIVEITPNGNAFVALRANGQIIAWGNSAWGGKLPAPIDTMDDILHVVGTQDAFAALRANGTVVSWGVTEVPDPIASLTDIVTLVASHGSFAALRKGGEVVAWGLPGSGGDTSSVSAELVNVRAVYASGLAFAAVTGDKRVVTWGNSPYGGDSSSAVDLLNGHVSYEATPVSRGIGRRMP